MPIMELYNEIMDPEEHVAIYKAQMYV